MKVSSKSICRNKVSSLTIQKYSKIQRYRNKICYRTGTTKSINKGITQRQSATIATNKATDLSHVFWNLSPKIRRQVLQIESFTLLTSCRLASLALAGANASHFLAAHLIFTVLSLARPKQRSALPWSVVSAWISSVSLDFAWQS